MDKHGVFTKSDNFFDHSHQLSSKKQRAFVKQISYSVDDSSVRVTWANWEKAGQSLQNVKSWALSEGLKGQTTGFTV